MFWRSAKFVGKTLLTKRYSKCLIMQVKHLCEVKFEAKPYDLHLLEEGPSSEVTITKEEAMKYLKQMVECRKMEAAAAELYKEKIVRGFCHLYSGEEAIAVGIINLLRPGDTLITAYRCHAYTYLINGTIEMVLAELAGKITGCARGKGGSMHMYSDHFYGGNGIVGAHVPLGNGIGFAHKYRDTKNINFTVYGDGAANQGQVFESFNLAKLKMLPIVFICENNLYGLGTRMERASANTNFYARCDYIPGIRMEGMDLLQVMEAVKFGMKHVLDGKGPIILEMVTYRYFGHSMSDPGTSYRKREEIQNVRDTRDPIMLFKNRMLALGLATEEEIKAIEKEVKHVVDDVVKKVKEAKLPDVKELGYDLYAKDLGQKVRNNLIFNPYVHKNLGKPINMD